MSLSSSALASAWSDADWNWSGWRFNRQGRNRKRLLHEMQVFGSKFGHGTLPGILRAARTPDNLMSLELEYESIMIREKPQSSHGPSSTTAALCVRCPDKS
jgi:hypothetical protein